MWTVNGAIYLFGGRRADLWRFESGMWTWISGSNTINQVGNYGIKGIAASSNIPGARYYSISWIDSNNTLWLFGGYGYDSEGYDGRINFI